MRRLLHGAACALAATFATFTAMALQFGPPTVRATLSDASGDAVAVSSLEAYIANASLDRVAVVDQTLKVVAVVPVGRTPRYIAAGGAGFITSNAGDNTVSIRTQFNSAVTIPAGGSGPIVTSVANGNAYLLRPDGVVAVVDMRALTVSTFDTGLRSPTGHALNRAGNRLYVVDATGEVRVFDVTAPSPAQAMESFRVEGRPAAVAPGFDPKFYVLTDAAGGSITEIDLASNAVRSFALPGGPQGPRALTVDNDAVVAGFSNELVVFDIQSRNADYFRTAEILSLDSDSQSSLAFALEAGRNLWVIDPRTMQTATLPVAVGSTQVKFLYKPCNAFISGATLTVANVPCGDLPLGGISAHALWWAPLGAESGWGLNIAHHGSTLFGTWFTYDAQGQPTWFVMSNGANQQRNSYAGPLYRTTGPSFDSATFDPARVTRAPVGTMTINLVSVDSASMAATVDGTTIQKPLARQLFSWPVPVCAVGGSTGPLPIYQDLWWNPNESGWGLNIAHQGNILFITWFTYDTDGHATWFVGSDIEKTGNGTYSGTLYKTFGPPMTASPWDPSKVTRMPVGSATLTFRDDDNGTFAYTVNGVSGSKSITREIFASPATRCR